MAATLLSLSLLAMTAVNASPIKAVRAEIKQKRGVAFNETQVLGLFSEQPKFSWCYNWGQNTDHSAGLEYVPMLHGNQPEFTGPWVNSLLQKKPDYVFSFNEPDQCGGGGSCIENVWTAAQDHKTWVQDKINSNAQLQGIKIGAPSVTNGDAPKGKDYLQRFLGACQGCKFDFLNAHWYASATPNMYYDPLEKFKTQMTEIHNLRPEIPLWITEIGFDAGSDEDRKKQLGRILEWVDKTEWIQRYAYHMATPGILLNPGNSNTLSALGVEYATA